MKTTSKKIANDRVVIGNMYAPFCRTEPADKSEWASDIAKMKELGYQCLHGFCEWSRIEKVKGVYDFSDVDYLIELCKKNDILCIINIATQNTVGYHMPAWMENEYQGQGLVDNENFGITIRSLHNIPCLDDPWYRAEAEKYLKALAAHYKGDKRVAGWVVWGEPMLSSPHGHPICYCEHTLARFRDWCAKKYGTIDALNKAWSTEGPISFASFDDIRPPVGAIGHNGGYAAWSDWGHFMPANFARNIKWADSILKEGGATQPTIVEMFCYPSGGGVTNDVWELGKSADIIGSSCFVKPGVNVELALTIAASVAAREGKSMFVVEQCGGSRGYNYDHVTPTCDELISEASQAIGLGAKGLMYWCWRPRFTDYEAGTFGMCRADGKPLPRAFAGGKQAAAFASVGDKLINSHRRMQVAVLHMSGAVFAQEDGVREELLHSEMGAIRVFLDAHITPHVVNEEMIQQGLSDEIKVLVLPFSYSLDQATCDGIRRFAEKGGCVIADINLAFKQPDGRAWRNLPGGGLDKVFGFEKDEVEFLADECLLPADNPYAIPVKTFIDCITPTTAEVLESDNGRPLVTRCKFGKGEAWFFSFLAFASYQRTWGNVNFKKRIVDIVAQFDVKPFVSVKGFDDLPWPNICVAELVRDDGSKILTFTNTTREKWETKEIEAVVPGATKLSKLNGIGIDVATEGNCARFTLAPWQSVMLEVTQFENEV